MTYKNKTYLITGAASGIGKALSYYLADNGANVLLLDKHLKNLTKAYDICVLKNNNAKHALLPFDLANLNIENCSEMLAKIKHEYGKLDGLVHCATFIDGLTPIANFSPALWLQIMQINLNSPFLLTQLSLNLLKAAPKADIIFSISAVGQIPQAYFGAYAASNAALKNLSDTLSIELAENTQIRVNAIDPGDVLTPMRKKLFPFEDKSKLIMPEDAMILYTTILGN